MAGSIYHICNKSIASFGIFSKKANSFRFIQVLDYYNNVNKLTRLSKFLRNNKDYYPALLTPKENSVVKFISYVIMPDHYHLVIKVLDNKSIIHYINNIQNSYTRFFNEKYKRRGPLWQSYYRSVRVRTEEQLLHLTRYVHLNPTTAELINKPEEWRFSSYRDFIRDERILSEVITDVTIKSPKNYKNFCENQINYQRKLNKIKKLLLD